MYESDYDTPLEPETPLRRALFWLDRKTSDWAFGIFTVIALYGIYFGMQLASRGMDTHQQALAVARAPLVAVGIDTTTAGLLTDQQGTLQLTAADFARLAIVRDSARRLLAARVATSPRDTLAARGLRMLDSLAQPLPAPSRPVVTGVR